MAILPVIKGSRDKRATPEAAANTAAWTERPAEPLRSVNLSVDAPETHVRPLTVRLSIPLDANTSAVPAVSHVASTEQIAVPAQIQVHTSHGKSRLIRRDSLERREAFLKGKEGSRQRRRWENDRLLNNPWAQPPLPSDWEVRPTYRRWNVPYYLAPLWDAAEFQRSVEEKMKGKAKAKAKGRPGKARLTAAEEAASNVPKEVRAKLKHARAAKGLLQDLEEEIRLFLHKWNEKETRLRNEGLHDVDSEEEEIVFVGRNGITHDSPGRKERYADDVARQKLVFEGMADDKRASFGRWLVHSIATYYGLQTWSVTVGDPARREAYVGVGDRRATSFIDTSLALPRPLWGMV